MWSARFALALALALVVAPGCRDADRRDGAPASTPTAAPTTNDRPDARPGGDTHPAADERSSPSPDWQRAVPVRPGQVVITRTAGPLIAAPGSGEGEVVVVGSSAIGFAGLAGDSGAVLWQRLGERRPEPPAARGGRALLPGRCSHASPPPAPAGTTMLGCVEDIDVATGTVRSRHWLADRDAAPGARVLGWVDGDMLWQMGRAIAAFSVAQASDAATARRRYIVPEPLDPRVCGWSADRNALRVATCDGLLAFAATASAPQPIAAQWSVSAARSLDIAGPVAVKDRVFWVHDGRLDAVDEGAVAWTGAGRYANAPGALAAVADDSARSPSAQLIAVRTDGGIRPVAVDVRTGRVATTGDLAPGIQVLTAAISADGLALAIRRDSSLTRDVIAAYRRDLSLAWLWHLPRPQAPRIDPIGLAISGRAVYVFHGARYVARLSI